MRDSSPPDAIFDQRPHLFALVRREQELDAIGAGRPERMTRARGDRLHGHRQLRRAHAELGERRADVFFEPARRLLAARGDLRRDADRRALGRRARGLCIGEPRIAPGQRIELRAQLVRLRDHDVERAAVLARQPAQQREALVDPREPLGIALEPVRVPAELVRGVIDQRLDLGQLHADLVEPGIGAPRALDLARRRRDAIARAVVAAVEQLLGRARRALQLVDRREPYALELDRRILARHERRAIELVELIAQVVDARVALARIAAERGHRIVAPAQLRPRDRHRFAEPRFTAVARDERIEDLEVTRRIDEALMLVLARQIHEQPAELGEPRRGRQRAVDVRAAAPAALDHAADRDFVVDLACGQARAVEHAEHTRAQILGDLDDRLDDRLVGSRARDVRRRAPAAQQVHRLDDQRLARAGLAREHVHAGAELDLDIGQDREVRDSQMPQHHRPPERAPQCSFSRMTSKKLCFAS